MPGGVPVVPDVPDEADFQAWKKQHAAQGPSSSPHAPIPDEEDFRAWKAKQAGDLLTERGILNPQVAPRAQVPAAQPDATRALVRSRPNASGDLQAATANPGVQARFAGTVAGSHALNTLQGIPGMEALEAGVGAMGDKTYSQSLEGLRTRIKRDVGPAAGLEKMIGAAPLAAISSSPAVVGAVLGGGSRVLQADPNVGIGQRALEGTVGALGGAAVGKAFDLVPTAIRAKLAKEPTQNIAELGAARTAASEPLYNDFHALGDLGRTPKLDALLGTPNANGAVADGLPVVRRAIDAVKGESPVLAKLPDTDARVLGAVYQRVGDKAFRTLHGFQTDEARRALLGAIDEAAQAKGGSFADPVNAFREGSREINAVTRGRNAVENSLSTSGGSEKAALTKSPEALRQWFGNPGTNDVQRERAVEGVLGQVGRHGVVRMGRILGTPIVPRPSDALKEGNAILDRVAPTQALLKKLGLTTLNSPFSNP